MLFRDHHIRALASASDGVVAIEFKGQKITDIGQLGETDIPGLTRQFYGADKPSKIIDETTKQLIGRCLLEKISLGCPRDHGLKGLAVALFSAKFSQCRKFCDIGNASKPMDKAP